MKVAIIDYGMGNLYSVKKILYNLKVNGCIMRDKNIILQADKIICPGVGVFHQAMINLQNYDLLETLNTVAVKNARPFLGIFLGMQLMARTSEEGGGDDGFRLG